VVAQIDSNGVHLPSGEAVPNSRVRTRRHRAIAAGLATTLVGLAWLVPGANAQDGTAVQAQPAPADQLRTVDRTRAVAPAGTFDRLAAKADRSRTDRVRVIVGLQTAFTPEGGLDRGRVAAQRSGIDSARKQVVSSISGTDYDVVHRYETVPYVALSLSSEALEELQRSGEAASLQEDTLASPTLAQSTPLVEATEARTLGRNGSGQHVAILDTGVDKNHPFLAGKVVSEACFSANASCPGGVTDSTAVGSGVNCAYAVSGCRHGTHVAGIAAGKGAAFSGVAPEAKLISINVFSRFTGANCAGAGESPCTLSFTSDQIKGLDRVFALRNTFRIASVNMSLGGSKSTVNCDTDARKASIDNLRSAGIATAIASGNDGFSDGVSFPSCISTAITVGSTTEADAVSSFSNSSPLVELLAPGSSITSSVPGGGFATFNGTSMATPHVAGAWAVMRQVSAVSVPTILSHLQSTGKPITDPDNGVTKPRIRVLSASTRIRDTGFKAGASFILPGGDIASNGVGLATRAGGPASGTITISGIPAGAIVQHAALYWMTIGGPDPVAVFNGVSRSGTLVGASRDSCWNVNQLGPNRVYRHVFPLGQVTGNGNYTVSGVGGLAGADGQGASLVILYRNPASTKVGRLIIRHGAMTGNGTTPTMSHTFTGLTVPSGPSQVRYHAGLADGQVGATEGAMLFNGAAISPVNFYDGSDGALWDDDRRPLSVLTLPAGTTSRTNSITVGSDCLAWAYAALGYQHS
jgi:subtilisin family serine protease